MMKRIQEFCCQQPLGVVKNILQTSLLIFYFMYPHEFKMNLATLFCKEIEYAISCNCCYFQNLQQAACPFRSHVTCWVTDKNIHFYQQFNNSLQARKIFSMYLFNIIPYLHIPHYFVMKYLKILVAKLR